MTRTLHLCTQGLMVVAAFSAGCKPFDSDDRKSVKAAGLASPTGVPSKLTGPLYNASHTEVRPTDLRFLFDATLGRDTRVLVGIQSTPGAYFYVWTERGQYDPYVLWCHGWLENASGAIVPADWLKFAFSADLDRDGDSEIVGLQSGTNWMYAWPLATCYSGFGDPRYAVLQPSLNGRNLNGYIRNFTGADIPVDQLKFVLAGHFSGACDSSGNAWKDQIRGLHADNAYSYTWALNQTTLQVQNWIWSLPTDGYLRDSNGRDVSVNNLQYLIENRTDPSNSNFGGCNHEMIAISDNPTNPNDSFVYVWENQANAVRASMLCKNPASACTNRTLVFWLDAGNINGLIANADRFCGDRHCIEGAMSRINAVLQRFQAKYQVIALVNPNITPSYKGRLVRVLDLLNSAGIAFMFDTYTSDTGALCGLQPRFTQGHDTFSYSTFSCSPDPSQRGFVSMQKHPTGDITDNAFVDFYHARYGSYFAGFRIFEILAMYWEDYAYTYCNGVTRTPRYSRAVVEDIVRYASTTGKFVFFTDNKWHNPYERYQACNTWFPIQRVGQIDLPGIASDYPNTLLVGYSNNEGVRDAPGGATDGYLPHEYRLKNWHTRPPPIPNLLGRGLSNQTWVTDGHRMLFAETLPPEELAIWTADAFAKGMTLVQLEPFYYLFKWDPLTWADLSDAQDLVSTPWDTAGSPTDEMRVFAALMGVDLTGL